ncbi:hypothetical protein I4F81_001412 [Pyropia yezoensis]|uniref:Uncharacterized protein n=1 Tax=Pyropia yezoensis TaxID=2788 RepID=A0ACC3BLM4_PYRYE|nr:hypothetical protein I4F81_001412 [Neopyropia yezoensis]
MLVPWDNDRKSDECNAFCDRLPPVPCVRLQWPLRLRGEAILATRESGLEVDAAAAPPSPSDSTVIFKKPRKERVPITIAVKKQIYRLRSQGRAWSSVLASLPTGVSKEAGRKVYRARHKRLAMPDDDATGMRTVVRKGHYAGVDDRLRAWLAAIEQLEHKTAPFSFGLLQAKAVEIGRALKHDDFRASRGYLRGFLSRTGINQSPPVRGDAGAASGRDAQAAGQGGAPAGGVSATLKPASVSTAPAAAADAPASADAVPAYDDAVVVAGRATAASVSAWTAAAAMTADTVIVAGPASAASVPVSADVTVLAGGALPAAACGGPSFLTHRDEYAQALDDQERAGLVVRPRGRPAGWGGGLLAGGAANLMDVAIMVKDAWEELTSSAISHCWAKADVLGAIRNVDLLRLHGEYRPSFRSVSADVDVMLELMRGMSLGSKALAGLDDAAQRSVLKEWMEIEDRPAGVVGAADAVVQDWGTAGPDVAESADS